MALGKSKTNFSIDALLSENYSGRITFSSTSEPVDEHDSGVYFNHNKLFLLSTAEPGKDAQLPEQEIASQTHLQLTSSNDKQAENLRAQSIQCHLEFPELWQSFHRLGTEMIITRSGRRMFPAIQVRFSGLDRDKTYVVYLDVVPVDWHRYRYAYHRSRWLVTGKADSLVTGQRYRHPDTPLTGHQLTNHVLAFDRVKLTNNGTSKHGQIVLSSMHKYQPRIHISTTSRDVKDDSLAVENDVHTFSFPETSFIAVTAYQNQLITTLKIHSNPFAKGFRDVSKQNKYGRLAPMGGDECLVGIGGMCGSIGTRLSGSQGGSWVYTSSPAS